MKNKLPLLLLLISLLAQSQQKDWQNIIDYDLKFKIPKGYKVVDTFGLKIYSYVDDSKIVSVNISEDGIHSDIELESKSDLLKHYKGFIKGYASKMNYEILDSENFQNKKLTFQKSRLKVIYDDGFINYLDLHLLFLNDKTYLISFQYPEDPEEEVLEAKEYLFNSLSFSDSHTLKNQFSDIAEENSTAYKLGEAMGAWLAKFTIFGIIGIAIYLVTKRRKKK
ncbi:hypothetical protein M0D21_13230 [Aquimarina sp. D1M17]|uniref:hypothetical protein n=1 Tax=Aquimarina acroporae TaxID=2937283 RepID=UPI0020C0607F|nr:hypothetical protein [Aquimarina acroporae]MCK8522540.1 hypothetical protein [Aquimarina acroporae]